MSMKNTILSLCVTVTVSATSVSLGVNTSPNTSVLKANKYLILTNKQAGGAQILECPNHLFGTMKDGIAKIRETRAHLAKGQPCFVQFCVSDQMNSIRQCISLVDIAAINPYVHLNKKRPSPDTLLWPGVDHPMINTVREMKELAGDKPLLARIGIGGVESEYITKRPPTFEEVKWMIYATLGADFKGYVCVGGFDSKGRLRSLQAALLRYEDELGASRPVNWAQGNGLRPVSATCASGTLFVVLLSTQYFDHPQGGTLLPLPLDPKPESGEVILSPPDGVRILTGETLRGKPLDLRRETDRVRVPYTFKGGGEILIFRISGYEAIFAASRHPKTTQPAKENRNVKTTSE